MTTRQQQQAATAKKVMVLAWQFIKVNGMTKREAMRTAWCNVKARAQMLCREVVFCFTKKDGSTRIAQGTLQESVCPATLGTSKKNNAVQVYFDTVKGAWRSFLKANLQWYNKSREEYEAIARREEQRREFLVKIGVIDEEDEEEAEWDIRANAWSYEMAYGLE